MEDYTYRVIVFTPIILERGDWITEQEFMEFVNECIKTKEYNATFIKFFTKWQHRNAPFFGYGSFFYSKKEQYEFDNYTEAYQKYDTIIYNKESSYMKKLVRVNSKGKEEFVKDEINQPKIKINPRILKEDYEKKRKLHDGEL